MKILLSIIIPTYKRPTSLLRLLSSLKQEIDDSVEIIIVEQEVSNVKLFKDFCRRKEIPLIYLFLKNKSTSVAKNSGVKKAKGDYILFVDDDVVVKKGLIENHLNNYSDRRTGGVGGRVVTVGQQFELERKDVGRITFFGSFTDGFSSIVNQEIQTVLGCNASWRRDIFKEVSGFDEQFTGNAMREESDLSLRIKKQGYKILFEPKAVVEHLREPVGGARKTEGRIEWYFNFFSNETYFFLKHRPKIVVPLILLTRWEWALRCMFGFGREVNFRSMTTPFLGVIDGIKKYRRLKKEYAYWC